MQDFPYLGLTWGQRLVSAGVSHEQFATMLMFQPTSPFGAAIWIPLGQVNWSWWANAYVVGNTWVSFGTPGQTGGQVTPTFPQWTQTACPYANWGGWGFG